MKLKSKVLLDDEDFNKTQKKVKRETSQKESGSLAERVRCIEEKYLRFANKLHLELEIPDNHSWPWLSFEDLRFRGHYFLMNDKVCHIYFGHHVPYIETCAQCFKILRLAEDEISQLVEQELQVPPSCYQLSLTNIPARKQLFLELANKYHLEQFWPSYEIFSDETFYQKIRYSNKTLHCYRSTSLQCLYSENNRSPFLFLNCCYFCSKMRSQAENEIRRLIRYRLALLRLQKLKSDFKKVSPHFLSDLREFITF